MQQSKIVIFHGAYQPFTLETVDIPALKVGEVLVKNEYTTLCRSDLNTYCGKRQEKTPTILGHEVVGRIVAFGEDHPSVDERGANLQLNDRISWAIYASDPKEELSQRGIPQKASDLFKYGHEPITPNSNLHGGLSEFTILRQHTPIVKLTAHLPLPVAAIINCAGATVAGAIRLAGGLKQKNVLISGVGMLGMIACAMSKINGAAHLVAMDVAQERLEVASLYGATLGILANERSTKTLLEHFGKPNPFDVVIELSGVATAMEQSLQMLAVGGTAVWVGATHPQRKLEINAEQIVRNLWTIKGLHNYNQHDLVSAVTFMEQHYTDFSFETMVQGGFTLDQVQAAFEYGLKANPFRTGINI